MKEWDIMLEEGLYKCDKKHAKMHKKAYELMEIFNDTKYGDFKTRAKLAKKMFGKVGRNITLNKPIHIDYGINTIIGNNFYSNYNLTILDVCEVKIGNNVMFGPNVSIFTAGHPIDPDIRNELLEYGHKVSIGDNCWIGGNVVINPGVHIGNGVVIGSGSVVTQDIEDFVVAAGNPCRVIRYITDDDKILWEEKKIAYLEMKKGKKKKTK